MISFYDFRHCMYGYIGVLCIALRTSAKQRQDDGLPVLQPALRERGEQVGPEARELAGTRGRQAALAERLLERAGTFEASQHSLCRNRRAVHVPLRQILYCTITSMLIYCLLISHLRGALPTCGTRKLKKVWLLDSTYWWSSEYKIFATHIK